MHSVCSGSVASGRVIGDALAGLSLTHRQGCSVLFFPLYLKNKGSSRKTFISILNWSLLGNSHRIVLRVLQSLHLVKRHLETHVCCAHSQRLACAGPGPDKGGRGGAGLELAARREWPGAALETPHLHRPGSAARSAHRAPPTSPARPESSLYL